MEAFKEVIGYDSLKQDLIEIIDLMQNEEIYQKLGVSCPTGLLLYGEPGVGKTLLAKSFVKASGRKTIACRKTVSIQNFPEEIARCFEKAVQDSPSIILLDDLDKFANDDEDHCDSEAYVAVQACIDQIHDKDVFVIATANNINKLPNSLIRVGRFDRKILVGKPTDADSEKIISHYLKQKKLGTSIDIDTVSGLMGGSSCSTLESVINQSALFAGYKRSNQITTEDIVKSYLMVAHDIPKMYLTKTSNVNLHSQNGEADTIWHEAGHLAMSEILIPGCASIAVALADNNKATGFVKTDFGKAKLSELDRIKIESMITIASAAAIDITFGRVDPGSQHDISIVLGLLNGFNASLGGFAGLSFASSSRYCSSDALDEHRETASYILAELYFQETKELLCKNRDFLEKTAQALAENIVLTKPNIEKLRLESNIVR